VIKKSVSEAAWILVLPGETVSTHWKMLAIIYIVYTNLKMSLQIAVIFYVTSEDTRALFDTIFFLKVIV